MKGLLLQHQLIAPALLLWLWVGSQSVLSLTTTNNYSNNNSNSNKPTRRDFVNTAIIGSAVGLIESSFPHVSSAASNIDNLNNNHQQQQQLPFCVIGANGGTGTKCVQDILSRGMTVKASSRSGIYYETETEDATESNKNKKNNPLLLPTICDVTVPSTVDAAVKGCRAVIFAASASKQGGTPSAVDNIGLKNVALACIANKIPHLVIVSSGGVSKPDSPVYKFLNIFGGIMEEKIKGEDTIREMYANLNNDKDDNSKSSLTYTIIRPGGLTEDPIRGVSEIELNQGDMKSGRISRYDVAKLCVEVSFYPELTGSTTFECYDGDTRKGLGSVGMSNILKRNSDPSSEQVTGKERVGNSYKALFSGLEKDA
jgi:uncharacterized protein YbjT (DUF2867 family)